MRRKMLGGSVAARPNEPGDTVQIWFVKTGVMYEVITMKGDKAWLIDILKTWQFD